MARLEVRFAVPGEKSFVRFWNYVEHVPDDMSGAFQEMADEFFLNNEKTFDEQGPGWKPLAPSTVAQRARAGLGPEPILIRSGALVRSLTTRGAPGQVLRVTPKEMEIGTSIRYAMYHQTGNIKSDNYPPGTHPPKRSPLVIRAELRLKWQRIIDTFLREKFDYTGR